MLFFIPKSYGIRCLFILSLCWLSYPVAAQTSGTTSATNATATWLTETSLQINWTIPNLQYDELIVVGKAGTDFTDIPTGINFTANPSFTATGNDLFGGKVVYAGVGASVTVTNLPTSSRYFFRIFVRRGHVWTTGTPVASPDRPSVLVYKVTVLSGTSSSPPTFTVTPALNSLTASSPVTLRLDASQSYDLDGDRITYVWQFGGADTDARPTLDRTFTIQPGRFDGTPITVFGASVSISGGGGSQLLTIRLVDTPPVAVTAVEPGKCYRLLARVSNKVLGVEGSLLSDGAQVRQRTDASQLAQRWRFESVGSGFYKIEAVHSQKVLDVIWGSTANGAGVQQWTFNGNWSFNQHWSLRRNTEGYFQIIARHSGKALDVQSGNQLEGGFVMMNTVNAGLNQQWLLEERTCTTAPPTSTTTSPPTSTTTAPPTSTTGIAEGKCYRIQSRSSGLVLGVPGSSYEDGITLRQNTNTNQNWQKWQFTAVNGSYYRISVMHNGKGIQVANSATTDDALLQQWTYWGGDHQQWIVQRNNEGFYTFRNRNSNKAVTVRNASTAEGAEITQQTLGTGGNQQWSVIETTCAAPARMATIEAEGAATFSVRPNPASDHVLIDLSPALGKSVGLALTDLIGRTIRQTRVDAAPAQPYRFQFGQIPSGLYLIQVKAEGHQPAALRLFVQP